MTARTTSALARVAASPMSEAPRVSTCRTRSVIAATMRLAIAALLLSGCARPVESTTYPPMPIVRTGCPLECCLLGRWTAVRRTAALRMPAVRADTAFLVASGDVITALTNRLVITQPGVVTFTSSYAFRVRRQDSLATSESLSFAAGDTIYNVDLPGEGTDAWFWYRGHTYHASGGDLDVFSVHSATIDRPYNVLSTPTFEWWVEARDSHGRTGWIFQPDGFNEIGRCG